MSCCFSRTALPAGQLTARERNTFQTDFRRRKKNAAVQTEIPHFYDKLISNLKLFTVCLWKYLFATGVCSVCLTNNNLAVLHSATLLFLHSFSPVQMHRIVWACWEWVSSRARDIFLSFTESCKLLSYENVDKFILCVCNAVKLWSCVLAMRRHSHYSVRKSSRADRNVARSFSRRIQWSFPFFQPFPFLGLVLFFAFVFAAILIHEVSVRLTWMTQELMCWLWFIVQHSSQGIQRRWETIFAMEWNSIYTLNFISKPSSYCDARKKWQIKKRNRLIRTLLCIYLEIRNVVCFFCCVYVILFACHINFKMLAIRSEIEIKKVFFFLSTKRWRELQKSQSAHKTPCQDT